MKSRSIFFGVLLMFFLLAGTQHAVAQRTSDFSVTVTAVNQGYFACNVTSTFDFGSVDAAGTDFGTAGVNAVGRNAANDGAIYENAGGTVVWSCGAAPVSTVAIALTSTAADHTGDMADDDLEIRIQDTAGGTSTDYQLFTSQNNLITGMNVGLGAAVAGGNLDLRLNVLDVDPISTGTETWVVNMRATGNP